MAQQLLKGTITITTTALIGVFRSEDGETTYTYIAQDLPHFPFIFNKINAILDVVKPGILQSNMFFRGFIGPSTFAISTDGHEIVIQAQLQEAVIPPIPIAGVGKWKKSSS